MAFQTLGVGSTGGRVLCVERALGMRDPDTKFDRKTRSAVLRFQKRYLSSKYWTGKVDRKTWSKLKEKKKIKC